MDRQNGTRISRHGRLDDRQPTLQERGANAPLRHSQGGASRARPLVPEAKTRQQKQPPPNPSGRRQQHGSIPQHPTSAVGHSTKAFEQREAVAQVQDALGVPSKQIAQELGVSEATVRRYLRTPEQRAQSEARAQRQLHAAETARQAAAQLQELERAERAQAASGTPFGQSSLRHRPNGRRIGRNTRNHTIPSRKIHNGIRRQTESHPVDEHSTGRGRPSPASRRQKAQEKTPARQSPAGGQELEQVASTAQASHTMSTIPRQGRCVARFQPRGRKFPYGLAKRLCVAPAQRNFGHSPAFAIGLMAGDGKPKGTQDQMMPCTTAKHQLPLRTS